MREQKPARYMFENPQSLLVNEPLSFDYRWRCLMRKLHKAGLERKAGCLVRTRECMCVILAISTGITNSTQTNVPAVEPPHLCRPNSLSWVKRSCELRAYLSFRPVAEFIDHDWAVGNFGIG
jgi:hypothetical protein